MARINIEEQFWIEVATVAAKIGDRDRAIGNAIRWLGFAQEKHRQGRLVTEDEFVANGFSEYLFPQFAIRVEGGIKCIGAEKHFDWFKQKVEAGRSGGKESAKRRRDAKGRLMKVQAKPSKSKRTQAKPSEPKRNQAKPSVRLASPSPSESNKLLSLPGEANPDGSPSETKQTQENPVSVYCELWKEKVGKSPAMTGKDVGQLNRLAKDVGINRAVEIIQAYFAMPDPWFLKKGYDVTTMIANLSAIQQFEATGKLVTRKVVEKVEEQVDKVQGTGRRRRSIEEIEAEREAQLREAEMTKQLGVGNAD